MTNRRILTIVLVIALIVAPLAAIVYYVADDEPRTIEGAFVLTNPDFINKLGRYCAGELGYGELQRGTPVRVWDAHGNVLATGETTTGIQGDADCSFPFTLEPVPEADEYHVQYGDQPVFIFTRSQLDQADWDVRISVGA